ncbi:dihydropteroate synthase [Candidatus Palauibacter soopunensis]|uniref:dihydropteroate synthase n=1 Tax=Candidatus Palauibacter soopunensis TaxID=3056739 RepID=UPI00238CDAAD|nr:dihydropteroate synthase [Candidatus Palauibacter soopunensis]MDE2878766.1 dihydropteroate synthase [Candidatus Palauibacter soopunensis]
MIAGILNVTPDSFSDGGRFEQPRKAIARGRQIAEEGAAILDIGAESTRPGADPVPADEEWARLEPVLRGLRDLPIPVSVDTHKLEVAERAVDAGAAAINDVTALRADPALARLAARTGVGLVLMHMRGTPRTMQLDTAYGDVAAEVRGALAEARRTALEAGCEPDQIAVDPGIGFGKSLGGNLELLARLDEIASLGAAVWVGPSRKSFLGALLDVGPAERVTASVTACLAAARRGADVLRVHDVREMRQALDVEGAIDARRAGDVRGARPSARPRAAGGRN